MRAANLAIVTLVFAWQLAAQAPGPAVAATSSSGGDAWPLYDRAAKRIREGDKLGKSSPSASVLAFNPYPPFSAIWEKTAKDAYEFNASTLQAVHEASALTVAHWPVTGQGKDLRLWEPTNRPVGLKQLK